MSGSDARETGASARRKEPPARMEAFGFIPGGGSAMPVRASSTDLHSTGRIHARDCERGHVRDVAGTARAVEPRPLGHGRRRDNHGSTSYRPCPQCAQQRAAATPRFTLRTPQPTACLTRSHHDTSHRETSTLAPTTNLTTTTLPPPHHYSPINADRPVVFPVLATAARVRKPVRGEMRLVAISRMSTDIRSDLCIGPQ